MTRRPVCEDTFGGSRKCTRDPGHPGAHSDGVRFWQFAEDNAPEWIKRMREGRLVGKDLTPWAPR